jgi:hypothetical protein
VDDYHQRKRKLWARDRQKLDSLIELHRSRCVYCNLPVVRVKTIQDMGFEILDKHGNTITWRMGSLVVEYPIATVDHVVPLHENVDSGLVLACWHCNIRKSRYKTVKQPVEIPDLKPRRIL